MGTFFNRNTNLSKKIQLFPVTKQPNIPSLITTFTHQSKLTNPKSPIKIHQPKIKKKKPANSPTKKYKEKIKKTHYPFFNYGSGLRGIRRELLGLKNKPLPPLFKEIVLALVLPDLHQIVLSSPASLLSVHAGLIRFLAHICARTGPQRH